MAADPPWFAYTSRHNSDILIWTYAMQINGYYWTYTGAQTLSPQLHDAGWDDLVYQDYW